MEKSKQPLGKLYVFLLASLTSVLVLLAITPSILSTSVGSNFLSFVLEKRFSIKVSFKNLQLGWITSQSADAITLEAVDKSFHATAKDILNKSSLISMLFKDDHVGLTQIDLCNIYLSRKKQPSFSSDPSLKKSSFKSSFSILQNIFIRDGSIQIEQTAQNSSINHFQLNMQLRHDKVVIATKGSSLARDVEGFFDLFCGINLLNFDIEGRLNTSMFPLVIFDELLSLNSLLEKTFGPTFNANGSFHFTDDKLQCSLEMLSSTFKASIHTTQTADHVFLEKPSVISLTLTKEGLEALSENVSYLSNVYLSQPGSLQLFLDELKVPYIKKTLDFEKASYKSRLYTSSLNLINKKTKKPLVVNASTLSSTSDELAANIMFALKSSLNYNLKNPSYVNGSLQINSPLQSPYVTHLQAKITKLPTIILETFSAKSLDFIDLIGESLDVNIATKTSTDNPVFTLQMYSPLASIETIELQSTEEGLSITKPFSFVYKTPKKPFKEFLSKYDLSLTEVGTLRCVIDKAFISHKHFRQEGLQALSTSGSLQAEDILLSSPYLLGKCKLKNTKVDFSAPSLKKLEIKTTTGLAFVDSHSIQQDLLGSLQSLQAVGVIEKLTKKNLSIPYLHITSANDRLSLNLACSFTENLKKFSFLEPLSVNINLNPDLFNRLLNVSPKDTTFLFPTPLKFLMNADPFYVQENFSKKLKIDSSITIPQIKILDKLFGKEFTIENTQLITKGDGNLETLQAAFSSEIVPSDASLTTGTLQGEFISKSFSSLGFLDKPWSFKANSYRIPSSLFDVALGLNNTFSILLGPEFTNNFSSTHDSSTFNVEGDFKSKNILFGYHLLKTPEMLTLEAPLAGKLTLEKDSYSALESLFSQESLSKQTFTLNQPSDLFFKINQLKWLTKSNSLSQGPFFDAFLRNISEHLKGSLLDISLQSNLIDILCQENAQTASLKNFSLDCTKAEGLSPFVLNIRSEVSAKKQKETSNEGRFLSTVVLQNITSGNKQHVLSTKIEGSLTSFPTLILDMGFQLANLGKIPPSVILGHTLSSSFTAKFENTQGSIDADIKAEQAEGDLHAYTNNGVFKLSQPLKAKINITPKLVDFFFKNMNLNISQASAPLSLMIDNRGFHIPFDPYDFQSIQIRKGSINLGQITCTNTGNPQDVGSFFKLNIGAKDNLHLWFTPIDFSLSNGIMYIDRTEVLYNKAYEIAFWGKLDILQNYASMTLGLTQQSLRKGLGIKGLPRSFVLQLPMEGPVNDVKINKEIATTRIALFLAKTSGVTNYGGLWGGIASALSDFANDQTMVPPAKPPFPWEGKLSMFEEEQKKQDTVNIIR